MKWDEIAAHLPGRSMTSCRLHYQNYLERKCPWDEEKSNKLARLYERYVLCAVNLPAGPRIGILDELKIMPFCDIMLPDFLRCV